MKNTKNKPVRSSREKFPTTREGWYRYYAKRFEKTLAETTMRETAVHMALFYWLLLEAFGEVT